MPNKDKDPPLLKGFSSSGTGRGKALTSPTTSLWLAVIFVALLFGLMSIQRNISRIDKASNPEDLRYSPYLSDAPEKTAEIQPPPNPDFMFNRDEEVPILLEEDIALKSEAAPIEIQPIEMEIEVQMPDQLGPSKEN